VDPWQVLAVAAARTSRIRLGTMITPVARRWPWKLAREVTTLDRLQRGPEVQFARAGRAKIGGVRYAPSPILTTPREIR
jgi:hypothetical protein